MLWSKFLGLILLGYVGINALFAFGYVMCGPEALSFPSNSGIGNSFVRAFFFSVQTFSTIGYGHMFPVCIAPTYWFWPNLWWDYWDSHLLQDCCLPGFRDPRPVLFLANTQSLRHIMGLPLLNLELPIRTEIKLFSWKPRSF